MRKDRKYGGTLRRVHGRHPSPTKAASEFLPQFLQRLPRTLVATKKVREKKSNARRLYHPHHQEIFEEDIVAFMSMVDSAIERDDTLGKTCPSAAISDDVERNDKVVDGHDSGAHADFDDGEGGDDDDVVLTALSSYHHHMLPEPQDNCATFQTLSPTSPLRTKTKQKKVTASRFCTRSEVGTSFGDSTIFDSMGTWGDSTIDDSVGTLVVLQEEQEKDTSTAVSEGLLASEQNPVVSETKSDPSKRDAAQSPSNAYVVASIGERSNCPEPFFASPPIGQELSSSNEQTSPVRLVTNKQHRRKISRELSEELLAKSKNKTKFLSSPRHVSHTKGRESKRNNKPNTRRGTTNDVDGEVKSSNRRSRARGRKRRGHNETKKITKGVRSNGTATSHKTRTNSQDTERRRRPRSNDHSKKRRPSSAGAIQTRWRMLREERDSKAEPRRASHVPSRLESAELVEALTGKGTTVAASSSTSTTSGQGNKTIRHRNRQRGCEKGLTRSSKSFDGIHPQVASAKKTDIGKKYDILSLHQFEREKAHDFSGRKLISPTNEAQAPQKDATNKCKESTTKNKGESKRRRSLLQDNLKGTKEGPGVGGDVNPMDLSQSWHGPMGTTIVKKSSRLNKNRQVRRRGSSFSPQRSSSPLESCLKHRSCQDDMMAGVTSPLFQQKDMYLLLPKPADSAQLELMEILDPVVGLEISLESSRSWGQNQGSRTMDDVVHVAIDEDDGNSVNEAVPTTTTGSAVAKSQHSLPSATPLIQERRRQSLGNLNERRGALSSPHDSMSLNQTWHHPSSEVATVGSATSHASGRDVVQSPKAQRRRRLKRSSSPYDAKKVSPKSTPTKPRKAREEFEEGTVTTVAESLSPAPRQINAAGVLCLTDVGTVTSISSRRESYSTSSSLAKGQQHNATDCSASFGADDTTGSQEEHEFQCDFYDTDTQCSTRDVEGRRPTMARPSSTPPVVMRTPTHCRRKSQHGGLSSSITPPPSSSSSAVVPGRRFGKMRKAASLQNFNYTPEKINEDAVAEDGSATVKDYLTRNRNKSGKASSLTSPSELNQTWHHPKNDTSKKKWTYCGSPNLTKKDHYRKSKVGSSSR